MTTTKEKHALDPESVARVSPWMEAAVRLKEEHQLLRDRIVRIQTCARSIYAELDPERSRIILEVLQLRMEDFMSQLHKHSEWEEKEVFPVIEIYNRRMFKPSITPSIWVMEKDHELADLFVASFNETVDALPMVCSVELARKAAANLDQACLILLEHLELEEELIFPLADELLTDIDYFYS
ncbi:hemerythrin domain-containing protein [Paenibacillus chartarius]|uniref:Hemerythrin domain-containing protein n=1 Tax=Paenibacillus chartarius TaxID=747481 RepID=A0ABV6DHV6_9BACL